MRTLKKGFVHVIDDATYIYHVGGVSFESVRDPELIKEKNLMIERNLETLTDTASRILAARRKGIARRACSCSPLHQSASSSYWEKTLKVLYVIDQKPDGYPGGIEYHLLDILGIFIKKKTSCPYPLSGDEQPAS